MPCELVETSQSIGPASPGCVSGLGPRPEFEHRLGEIGGAFHGVDAERAFVLAGPVDLGKHRIRGAVARRGERGRARKCQHAGNEQAARDRSGMLSHSCLGRVHCAMGSAATKRFRMLPLTLYHASPSRSSIALWMLEELGEPYDVHLLKLRQGREPKRRTIWRSIRWARCRRSSMATPSSPRWRRSAPISPTSFPPRSSTCRSARRSAASISNGCSSGPSCIEPAVIDRAAPRKEEARRAMLGYGDFDTTHERGREGGRQGAVDLMGEQFTAADVVIGCEHPLGHDVQDDPGAAGVHRLCGAHRRAPGGAARRGEGQGARRIVRSASRPESHLKDITDARASLSSSKSS